MIEKNSEVHQHEHHININTGLNLVLPIIVWAGLILVFLNVKYLPFNLTETGDVVLRQFVKIAMTILLPLGLIHLLYKEKSDFGIYFPAFYESFRLSFKAFTVIGPACMSFLLIGILGLGFGDWPGAILLTIAFSGAAYFLPRGTQSFPTRNSIIRSNSKISSLVILSFLTLAVTHFTFELSPIISNIFYYVLIVGLGEEVFFRGYIQSSLNRYFGKSMRIGSVKFGWGLILAALLFGLSHALVTVPPTWPWAVWTFIMGLSLGFIREKDGSILAAAMLHAMLDFPLVFMG